MERNKNKNSIKTILSNGLSVLGIKTIDKF